MYFVLCAWEAETTIFFLWPKYGVFPISAKFVSEIHTLIATTSASLVFSWVFGSANSVTRPDRRNAKMVYSPRNFCYYSFSASVSFDFETRIKSTCTSTSRFNYFDMSIWKKYANHSTSSVGLQLVSITRRPLFCLRYCKQKLCY